MFVESHIVDLEAHIEDISLLFDDSFDETTSPSCSLDTHALHIFPHGSRLSSSSSIRHAPNLVVASFGINMGTYEQSSKTSQWASSSLNQLDSCTYMHLPSWGDILHLQLVSSLPKRRNIVRRSCIHICILCRLSSLTTTRHVLWGGFINLLSFSLLLGESYIVPSERNSTSSLV